MVQRLQAAARQLCVKHLPWQEPTTRDQVPSDMHTAVGLPADSVQLAVQERPTAVTLPMGVTLLQSNTPFLGFGGLPVQTAKQHNTSTAHP